MLREIGDWFAALFVAAALIVSALGAVEWHAGMQKAAEVTADSFTVALDAGHGGFDGGATGVVSGTPESGLNLAVAELVKQRLEGNGIVVVMTRTEDVALGANKEKDLAKRRTIIADESVDLVVSIHMNKFTDANISGAMTFYQSGSAEGQKLAQAVIDAVCDATAHKRRLANPGDYFVLRECASPAVLVECGFLSNAAEEEKLLDPAYQTILAEAIAEGVLDYLSVSG